MTRLYSFDVFDTCLIRLCARPQDLFWFAAHELVHASHTAADAEELTSWLYHARKEAETNIRRQKQGVEINLDEIYEAIQLPDSLIELLKPLREKELELERRFLIPVIPIRDEIQALREKGYSVVYISDMYLPEAFIQEGLEANGFWSEGDRLYVSNTYGKMKADGSLFEQVKKDEGAHYADWLHVGDNVDADIQAARKLGIQTRLFADATLNTYELESLGDEHLGFAERSLLAGLSRAARLSLPLNPEYIQVAAFSSVVAPLYTLFLLDVFKSAELTSLKRLYFLARDGQIMYKMARALNSNADLDIRYLYGSRRAWLPYLLNPKSSTQKLDWLENEKGYDPELILKIFNIPKHDFEPLLLKYRSLEWKKKSVREQVEGLMAEPSLRPSIEVEAIDQIVLIQQYLKQEGFADEGPAGIVDVGWSMRMQDVLNDMLQELLDVPPVRGMYLGGTKGRLPYGEPGDYWCWVREEEVCEGAMTSGRYLFMYILVFEQIFGMADHETVLGYEKSDHGVVPRLRKADSVSDDLCHSLHAVCSAYAGHARTVSQWIDQPSAKSHILYLLRYFFTCPLAIDVYALQGLQVDSSMDDSLKVPLVKPLSLSESIKLGRNPNSGDPSSRYWLEGSLVISSRWSRLLFRLMRKLCLKVRSI